ncbi:transcriptional regulator with XRE-family HTH domain [Mesorhizobium soli]|uniref:helix-turn-helix domain-containing protein n=1 Tax=Pseudaminobacter soli (ex Li et al. 2025) TaxID=1295366 RepID=UPI0024739424|nr:helix-turn-helix transcriptional regulator [Mesorhizobium soli]MDH6229505.1 transcriptional regulator with XRE-family HTH domain [Mesorhizobium soli]
MSDTTNIYDEIPDFDTIGGRLCRARDASTMSVKQLALRLGVKTSTIKAWESDRSQPGAHRLNTLCGLLSVSVSWVLHGVGAAPVEAEDEDEDEDIKALGSQLDKLRHLHAETGNLIRRLQNDMDRLATN